MMQAKYLARVLSKAKIQSFLALEKTGSKEQVVTSLQQLVEENEQERARLLEMYPCELAVEPVELQEILGCTRNERRRWIEEGRLPVLEYRAWRKGGHELLYPVHDRRVVEGLTAVELTEWRRAHQEQMQEHHRLAGQKAAQRRQEYRQMRQQFQLTWQQMVEQWQQQGSALLVAVFQLAYWTVWASRWAKENQLRALHSTKLGQIYEQRKDAWYKRKNESMRLLAFTPYARISFYRPEAADKRYLWLCEEHYELKRDGYYSDIWEFFSLHAGLIKACPECVFHEEKDFYALYHLELLDAALPDLHFSFHMPYPIGRSCFPKPSTLPAVTHVEQDGLFRFGRALFAEEKITHRENDVEREFTQALEHLRQLSIEASRASFF